jgi:hypothetical protein
MSKFRFSLISPECRHEGTIHGPSFQDAVESLWQHVDVHRGDVLEIGVNGFPPARYQCSATLVTGKPMWSLAA